MLATLRRLAVLSIFIILPASAQDVAKPAPARDSVVAVVNRLFQGMKSGDTTMMRSTIALGTTMGSVPAPGRPVRFGTVDSWLQGLSRSAPGTLEERTFEPEVRIDGGLATVWVEYTFFISGKVSHCGVDAIQLVRTGEGWKIIAIADSQRKTDCRS